MPDYNLVEKLWLVLFEMFEIASGKKLDKLFDMTVNNQSNQVIRFHSNSYNKGINPEHTNFDEWRI